MSACDLAPEEARDFTLRARVLRMCALAIPIGALSALVAVLLLWMIGLFTNLFFHGRIDTALVAPRSSHWAVILLVPVLGGLIGGRPRRGPR